MMQPVTFVLCMLVLGAHALLVAGVGCDYQGQLNVGESKTTDNCVLTTCKADGVIEGKACPSTLSHKDCHAIKDLSKPYPYCCPKC